MNRERAFVSVVRAVELSESPLLRRVHPADVRALNRVHALGGRPLTLAVRGQRVEARASATMPPAPCAGYRFTLGSRAGTLGLDPLAEVLLLGDRRAPALPAELRAVLLAEALQPLVETLERLLRLRFDWQPAQAAQAPAEPPGAPALDTLAFTLAQADGGGSGAGFVRLDEAGALESLLPALRPPAPSAPPWLDALLLRLVFTLGSTPMRLHEMRAIRAGDIVAVERWAGDGAALMLYAGLGGERGWRVHARAEDRQITVTTIEDMTMNRDLPDDTGTVDDAATPSPRLERLDAMEVTLRFDVGEQALSIGQLKTLRPGHVFELAHALNRSPVNIVAHGNLLGRGVLVAVGDRLGVRISEFAPGEL